MTNQSNIQFTLVAPANVPTPPANYYAIFLSDGSSSTIAGVLYRKDSGGTVTIAQDTSANFTNAKAQDAVGGILQNSGTVQLVYDTTNRLISANVLPGSIATTHLVDASVTNPKLTSMPESTFKMRALGSGTGAPIDGTAVQAKAALAITYSDVAGLGTAAQQPATAFDTAGAAATAQAAAQAASQPVNTQLTAISGLTTTTYGRNLLTVADAASLTTLPNVATRTLQGMMAPADKVKLDNRGQLGTITTTQGSGTSGTYVAMLTAAVPAGMPAGTNIRVTLNGYATTSGTVSFRVHAGSAGGASDAAVWTSITSPTLSTNQRAGFDGLLTMRSTSAVLCEAQGYGYTSMMPAATAAPATVAVSTGSTWYITLSTNISVLGGFSVLNAVVEAV